MFLPNIPYEIWCHIISYLDDTETINNVSKVNREFNWIVENDLAVAVNLYNNMNSLLEFICSQIYYERDVNNIIKILRLGSYKKYLSLRELCYILSYVSISEVDIDGSITSCLIEELKKYPLKEIVLYVCHIVEYDIEDDDECDDIETTNISESILEAVNNTDFSMAEDEELKKFFKVLYESIIKRTYNKWIDNLDIVDCIISAIPQLKPDLLSILEKCQITEKTFWQIATELDLVLLLYFLFKISNKYIPDDVDINYLIACGLRSGSEQAIQFLSRC